MDRRIDKITEVENTALQTQMRHMQTARDRVIQENARLEADIDERKAKQRALSRNASRTRKRAEKRHQDEVDKAKLAASMIIKVRHGNGPRAHATTRAWIAQLKQLDIGRIASNNSAVLMHGAKGAERLIFARSHDRR